MKVRKICIVLLVILIQLAAGCQPSPNLNEISHAPYLADRTLSKSFTPLFFQENAIQRLNVTDDQFNTIADWLDNETILYIKDTSTHSEVHTFHLFSGESSLFYQTDDPILSIISNNSKKLFAIHTAPSPVEACLIIVNLSGEVIADWSFPNSNDLTISWDPHSDEQLFVSSFQEDWTFESYLLDVPTGNAVKKELDNPFIQWFNHSKVGYLNWNQDEPSLTAPLIAHDLATNSKELLMENIIMFASYSNLLLTVTNKTGEEEMADYQFLELPGMKTSYSFSVPLLSMYSNYFTPFFEFVEATQMLYTFSPYKGGNLDSYSDLFQLVSFNALNGERKVEMDDMSNKPIKFSPNGMYCLYGYKLEQLITISNKEILELVDYS